MHFKPLSITLFLLTFSLLPTVLAQKIVCGGAGALIGCPESGSADKNAILTKGGEIGSSIIPNVISTIIGLLAFVAMAYLVKGGIAFIQAQGSMDKIKSAQKSMIAAAVGLVIAMSAYILVQIAANIILTP